MARKLVSATVSAALCLTTLTPGMATAQEHRFTGFDAPRGASATMNLRIPLGRHDRRTTTYGLTLSYGQPAGADLSGRTVTRGFRFADLRFDGDGFSQARVASFDLANLDQDPRMNLLGDAKKSLVIGAVLVALGVFLCVTEICDSDESDEPDNGNTANPVG